MPPRHGGKARRVTDADDLERELLQDLFPLRHRLREDWFAKELYQGLTNTAWRKADGPDGHLSLSWSRAERIVNELREREGDPPLDLAQTGGEGEVSERVADALDTLGWHPRPATAGHDDAHVDAEPQRPHRDTEPPEWRRQADAEAEENRR
jgi:hypothetical protein